MRDFLIIVISVTILVIGLFSVATAAGLLDKHERHECIVWQERSQERPGWWSKHWQVEQCEKFNIDLSRFIK